MGNSFTRCIDHGAKKASPIAQEKGKKKHKGNNNSKLERMGYEHNSLFNTVAGFQIPKECDHFLSFFRSSIKEIFIKKLEHPVYGKELSMSYHTL